MKKIMRHSAAYKVPLESLDVVVVDDSKQMQTIIRSVLGAMRVQRVRTFDSAERALQAMLSEPPHLIITDWRMEPVTGYQLLRSIRHRQMAPLCFVPVLLVTAHSTRSLVEKALRAGAHHVLVKPLAPTALLQRLQWIVRDERKFCVEPGQDFFVIEGVAAALAVQSERRQALDEARLHHARNGGVRGLARQAPDLVKQARNAVKEKEGPLELVEPVSSRGLGDLVQPKSGALKVGSSHATGKAGAISKAGADGRNGGTNKDVEGLAHAARIRAAAAHSGKSTQGVTREGGGKAAGPTAPKDGSGPNKSPANTSDKTTPRPASGAAKDGPAAKQHRRTRGL